MKKVLSLTLLMAASAMAGEFNYTNLDFGYLNGKADLPGALATYAGLEDDLDVEGFFASGRYEFTDHFFGYVRYENGEIRTDLIGGGGLDADVWRLEVGIGGSLPLGETVDVYYGIGYKHTDLDFGFLGDQKVGNVDLHVGLRWAPVSWLELNPHLEHSIAVENDDVLDAVDVTSIGLNAYVTAFEYVQPFAGVTYDIDSSSDNVLKDQLLYTAGLRFSF